MTDNGVHGPIDYIVIEFPGDQFPGDAADEVLALVDSDVIRLYDVVLLAKDASGVTRTVDLTSTPAAQIGAYQLLSGARSGLLNDDDVRDIASTLEPGTLGLAVVYENSWAIPFVGAAFNAGGGVVASTRIPAADVIAALDALDALDPAL